MRNDWTLSFRIHGRTLLAVALVAVALFVFAATFDGTMAQKTQESYKDKFNIAENQGGVAVACSADGRYVYVAGPQGVIVSEDFGRTGSWLQTVKLK